MSSTAYHPVEKSFRDYASDIEGVNIHYVVTPLDGTPDWENYRSTRFMPVVKDKIRSKLLKLPKHIKDPTTGTDTARYLLYYYFEIFQAGDRHYSQLFTEEIITELSAPLTVALPKSQAVAATK